MVAAANMVEVAALVGDTARATILAALMGGQALTATELAFIARISRPTASEHLVKLTEARLIAVTQLGRYRYYRIASPLVAHMLESIIAVAAIEVPPRYQPRSMKDDALRFARTCYDHLAGQLGVALADALVVNGQIVFGEDGGEVTPAGMRLFTAFGLDLTAQSRSAHYPRGPSRRLQPGEQDYEHGQRIKRSARSRIRRANAADGRRRRRDLRRQRALPDRSDLRSLSSCPGHPAATIRGACALLVTHRSPRLAGPSAALCPARESPEPTPLLLI